MTRRKIWNSTGLEARGKRVSMRRGQEVMLRISKNRESKD